MHALTALVVRRLLSQIFINEDIEHRDVCTHAALSDMKHWASLVSRVLSSFFPLQAFKTSIRQHVLFKCQLTHIAAVQRMQTHWDGKKGRNFNENKMFVSFFDKCYDSVNALTWLKVLNTVWLSRAVPKSNVLMVREYGSFSSYDWCFLAGCNYMLFLYVMLGTIFSQI